MYTYKKLAEEVLKNIGRPMKAVEIWEEAVKLGLNLKLPSVGKTPWNSIGAQIYIEIRDNSNTTCFCKLDSYPGYFFIKGMDVPANFKNDYGMFGDNHALQLSEQATYCEKDLHKMLVTFMHNPESFDCECLTISEKVSSKGIKGQLEWIHPDIVGVHYYYEDHKDVYDLIKATGNAPFKLYSFEMKKTLSFGNIKESFFQCVSNSSWANEGYLVALDVDRSEDFLKTLRRLSNSFGIGIIQLNPQHIFESDIICAAKSKDVLDWDAIEELCNHNQQFRHFIQNVISSSKVKSIVGKYDPYFDSSEEASKYAKSKGMLK